MALKLIGAYSRINPSMVSFPYSFVGLICLKQEIIAHNVFLTKSSRFHTELRKQSFMFFAPAAWKSLQTDL